MVRTFGTAEVKELLQTVNHGSTEHSIIFRPNAMTFDVAVGSANLTLWYAPFLTWYTFSFHDLFTS